ncbi:MAG: DegT/DnrJ/EryC1/StrS family aminotransferase [Chromatiaceae bacterium]|nr:DegT/DnrJ/EryC1/StrS family aminotransferase [Chromatiaceae bacterium]
MILQSNPKAGYLAHQVEIDAALRRVLESGWYILGPEVAAFEAEFAAYLGLPHAIGVATGTDALELALRGCGIGPGHVVFTVSHTAVATVAAIERCGAEPVLVDIDPATYTLDPNALEGAVRVRRDNRPVAVVPVHLYGHPADMPAILDIARRHDLRVVEDCAQAHGARLAGRLTGTWGDAAAFSFYPTKNLGALGDGGAVVTASPAFAARVRELRQYGWRERYISAVPGINSRLDELQAAVLRVKLRHLDAGNERRRVIAARYREALSGARVSLPICEAGVDHVYHQFVIRSPERDRLQGQLQELGIGTLVHYPRAVHSQPAYADRLAHGDLTHSEQAAASVLSLPMYPELADAQVARVAETLRNLLNC